MRRINSIATIAIMILFVIHLIQGVLVLFGMIKGGSSLFSVLSYIMVGFIVLHIILSLKLTYDTVRATRRAGVSYWKENRLFWVRRISGFALMAFLIIHVLVFHGQNIEGVFLLHRFDILKLISQILLVVSLFLHLVTNIRPLKIAFGLEDKKNIRIDIALILSILLLIAGMAFVVYFIRWMVI